MGVGCDIWEMGRRKGEGGCTPRIKNSVGLLEGARLSALESVLDQEVVSSVVVLVNWVGLVSCRI